MLEGGRSIEERRDWSRENAVLPQKSGERFGLVHWGLTPQHQRGGDDDEMSV